MKHPFRIGASKLLLIAIIIISSGCGAATAPPVELPAPVTGRITVGTPDSSGKSVITGTSGAVEGGAIVLALNERIASSSALWKMTDFLIPTAYAQLEDILPAICESLGHWCVVAGEDGSFEMIIDAIIGDSIILVIIDENGIEISERATFTIPSTDLDIGTCEAFGVDGTMKWLMNLDRESIVLYEGSSTGPNILDVENFIPIPLPGCFAKDFDVIPGATGGRLIMISDQDQIVWIANIDNDSFIYANTYILEQKPLFAAYIGDYDYAAIGLETTDGFAIGRISLIDGTIDKILSIPPPSTGHVYEEMVSFSTIGPFANNGHLGVAIMKGNLSGSIAYFATFFESVNFSDASIGGDPIPMSLIISPVMDDMGDAMLVVNDLTQNEAHLVFTDRTSNYLRPLAVGFAGQPVTVTSSFDASTFTGGVDLFYNPSLDREPFPSDLVPGRFSIGWVLQYPVAYILVDDPAHDENLWVVGDFAAVPAKANFTTTIPGAADPQLISVDQTSQSILVGDIGLGSILDATDQWLSGF